MARKEPENFYRRQQEEANRIAAKQHRALVDLVRLAKSSNEELRKMRRSFEAFAEAVGGMKLEPFQLQAFTAARAEAERTVKIAEGEHPPPLFDAKAFKEVLDRGEAPVVSEGEPYPEVQIEPDHSKKRVEARSQRAPRLGFGDVVASMDESTAPPLVVVDEAEAGTVSAGIQAALNDDGESFGFTVNLNADGELINALPMQPATGVPVKLGGKIVGTADIFEDGTASIFFNDLMEIPAHHGEFDLFWKYDLVGDGGASEEGPSEALPEEECADVSEARRTPQGYAAGGYTGVSYWATEEEQERLSEGPSKFGVPINQRAGVVHPGELWGTAEQLQRMRDLGLIVEGTITYETDAQIDMDLSQGRE